MFHKKLNIFLEEYYNYSFKHPLGQKYLQAERVLLETKYYRLFFYKGDNNLLIERDFLVIPSIFNSPEILFLSKTESYIENLKKCGDVYLIEWLEVTLPSYSLNDYVLKLLEVVEFLYKKLSRTLDLVGHCIGGVFAIAATVLFPCAINTLTLLSTPWDFSHFILPITLYERILFKFQIKNYLLVPKLHISILFFLFLPRAFKSRIKHFFSLKTSKEKDLSFRVQNWLFSGVALANSTYNQIIEEVIKDGILIKRLWKINGTVIDPSVIRQQVYQVIGKSDHLVSSTSSAFLGSLFSSCFVVEAPGGHITYLLENSISSLFLEYQKREKVYDSE